MATSATSWRWTGWASLLPLLVATGAAQAQTATGPALDAFIAHPQVESAVLSPDAQHLALTVHLDNKTVLFSQRPDGSDRRAITALDDGSFDFVTWLGPQRLWLGVSTQLARDGQWYPVWQPLSVNLDGSQVVNLARQRPGGPAGDLSWQSGRFIGQLPDGTHMLMEFPSGTENGTQVYRVDTLTGTSELVQAPLKGLSNWRTDQQKRIRLASRVVQGAEEFWGRSPDQSDWHVLWSQRADDAVERLPRYFAEDPHWLRLNRTEAGKTEAIWVRWDQPLVSATLPAEANPPATAARETLKGELDKVLAEAFPGSRFSHWFPTEASTQYVLQVSGDVQPISFYVGDINTGKLQPVGSSLPGLTGHVFAPSEWVELPATAGQAAVRKKLIRPAMQVAAKAPTVIVFGPGGEDVQGREGFDPVGRWLSAQGYAVLRMSVNDPAETRPYRLTVDKVKALRATSQGRAAQALAWLATQDWADAGRVCVLGTDRWAAYAALSLAPAAAPGLTCVASEDAITEPADQFNAWLMGRAGDASILDIGSQQTVARSVAVQALSLERQAADWRVPTLLMHAKRNGNPAPSQSTSLAKALADAGHPAELFILERSNGTWQIDAERLAAYQTLQRFLARHLLAGATAPAQPAQ